MTSLPSTTTIRSLQLGMSWLPEQAGNGLDRMYHGLTQHLPQAGVSVRGLIAGSPAVEADTGGVISAFASDHSPVWTRLRTARRSIRALLDEGPVDLVATHFALYTAPALDLLGPTPLVVHFHGPWGQESRVEGDGPLLAWAKTQLERAVYRRGTAFIVLSSAFRDVLRHEFGVASDRIHVVPGGVDADTFDTKGSRSAARERLGWPQTRPTIVAVRRLARRMGLENLVQAMVEVREEVPNALLCVAGKGPLEAELRAQIDTLGLGDHVRLLGFVPEADLPYLYRAADVSIVPTVSLEGFGLTTVESLAAGTPVLVTPRGGLPEVVSGLDSALILPGHAPQELATGLIRSLNGTLALPSSTACQTYAREHFHWPSIAAQTRRVYESVLS